MSCKIDLSSPVYCFECDPFDDSWICCKAGNSKQCEMYDRYHNAKNFSEYMETECTCCYACHYTRVLRVEDDDPEIEVRDNARIACSKCHSLVCYMLDSVDIYFYSIQEVHRYSEQRRDERIFRTMLGIDYAQMLF
jgi:hypothetical protein